MERLERRPCYVGGVDLCSGMAWYGVAAFEAKTRTDEALVLRASPPQPCPLQIPARYVLLERVKSQSRSAPNWAIRGIRFGKADREKSRNVLGTVVEEMQREFELADHNEAAEAVPADGS
jgi:hypothetical protein